MRASLLANATASLFLCNRSDAALSHGPKLYRAQLCGRIRRTFAAWISSVRKYLLPRLGNAAKNRPAARTVLSPHEPQPGGKIATALESLTAADRRDPAETRRRSCRRGGAGATERLSA